LRVVVLGTKFSVRQDPGELRVLVTEGRVQVARSDGGRDVPIVLLSTGSVAHMRDDGMLVRQQSLSRLEESLSWRTGFIVFHGTPLSEAVAELNRYNQRKILIQDPSIAALRISGNFRATNGDAFARLLEDGFPIHAEIGEQRIFLRAK
jgi:transmembrane sensor